MTAPPALAPVDPRLDPGRRFREGSSYSYKANILSFDPVVEDRRAGHAAHEISHFLTHAATPYGHVLDELTSLQNANVIEFYRDFAIRLDEPAPFPGYAFAQRVLAGDVPSRWRGLPGETLRDLVDTYVVLWSEAAFLENVLEGSPVPSVLDTLQPRAAQALATVERAEITRQDENKVFSEVARIVGDVPSAGEHIGRPVTTYPDGLACQFTPHRGMRHPLGGSAIFEALAVTAEEAAADMQQLVDNHFDYVALWILFIDKFGADRVDSAELFFALRDTFSAICDLALFTPIGAVYGRLRAPDSAWHDVHPGLRYLGALEAVKVLDLWTAGDDPLTLQRRVSEAFGWADPQKFLELGAALNLSANDDAWRHMAACQLRLDNHDVFMHQERHTEQWEQFFQEHLPLYWSARDDKLVMRRHELDVTPALHLILDHFFCQLFWNVMMTDRVIGTEMLPAKLDLTEAFATPGNPRTPDDFLRIIYEGLPYFAPERLRHIES